MVTNPLAPSWLTVPADVNALPVNVWPASATRNADGVIEIGGVPVTALKEQFGSPLYVIDEADARARAARIHDAFTAAAEAVGTTVTVYYAGKAFLSTEVARWVIEAGLNLDTCSAGELAVALAAGVDPARLGLHGNNKSLAEIDRAVSVGLGTIVIDSEQEIERVAAAASRHGRRQRVRLRVKSGVHAETHAYLATAHEDQKFGVSLDEVERLVAGIRSHESLDFVGLHCHNGTQVFGSAGIAESARRLLAVHARLLEDGPVPELNLGGGFGIAYNTGDEATDAWELAAPIIDSVAAHCAALGIPVPHLAFEPGRAIIGTPGVTLYELGTTKPVTVEAEGGATATRLYASVDGGMSDNARYALYQAQFSARLASRRSDASPALVRIAGKHCESGDIVVDAEYLPGDIAPGDLLVVPATGAYCFSLSSRYNYLPRPAVVAVRDGQARVIVRGETEEDLLSHDAGVRA
ncbi:diaminopimelate decarboxylase [Gryllotalpicola daejeonensis]|uniref:Diaminopimelate decarboxylase n=1 Tax=Gryllotalpicola daejeonensis TaxID=993087 RepID=A0ABP7ZMR8_9MICO